MAQQTKTITSEALEATYRDQTPSQSGFTEDLMASNVIIPVIDLTNTSVGTQSLPAEYLAAISIDGDRFSSDATGANQVVSTTTGFIRCFGTLTKMIADSAGNYEANLKLFDGTSSYNVLYGQMISGITTQTFATLQFDFIYFAGSGVSLRYDGASFAEIDLVCRQVATITGTLINPTGYTPQ